MVASNAMLMNVMILLLIVYFKGIRHILLALPSFSACPT